MGNAGRRLLKQYYISVIQTWQFILKKPISKQRN